MPDDPLLSAQRSLIRVAVVAVALIGAAALFARCARQRTGTSEVVTAKTAPLALVPAIERALESRLPAPAGGDGRTLCAAVPVGAEAAAEGRRRVFVLATCRQLCVRNGTVAIGTGVAFPAAAVVVGDHVVGTEAPTDAHYAADVRAIFPPATRQLMDSDGTARRLRTRLDGRVAQLFPGARWLGDEAPGGCEAPPTGTGGAP